jgi:hypothetical protein
MSAWMQTLPRQSVRCERCGCRAARVRRETGYGKPCRCGGTWRYIGPRQITGGKLARRPLYAER